MPQACGQVEKVQAEFAETISGTDRNALERVAVGASDRLFFY